MDEYWEERKQNPKYILIIGITLLVFSIFLSLLSSIETNEIKTISGETELSKNSSKEIILVNPSRVSYSYIKSGNITFNSNSSFYVSFSDENKYYLVYKNASINLKKFSFTVFILNQEPVKISYKATFQLVTKPYIYLALPSLFMVIAGAILAFAGMYMVALRRYHY